MNEKGKEISISIEFNNPCRNCNGDCDACGYYNDGIDYDSIKAEAEAFRLSLNVNLRRHNELTINL